MLSCRGLSPLACSIGKSPHRRCVRFDGREWEDSGRQVEDCKLGAAKNPLRRLAREEENGAETCGKLHGYGRLLGEDDLRYRSGTGSVSRQLGQCEIGGCLMLLESLAA